MLSTDMSVLDFRCDSCPKSSDVLYLIYDFTFRVLGVCVDAVPSCMFITVFLTRLNVRQKGLIYKTTNTYIYIYKNFSQPNNILVYIMFIIYNIRATSYGFMPSSGPL